MLSLEDDFSQSITQTGRFVVHKRQPLDGSQMARLRNMCYRQEEQAYNRQPGAFFCTIRRPFGPMYQFTHSSRRALAHWFWRDVDTYQLSAKTFYEAEGPACYLDHLSKAGYNVVEFAEHCWEAEREKEPDEVDEKYWVTQSNEHFEPRTNFNERRLLTMQRRS